MPAEACLAVNSTSSSPPSPTVLWDAIQHAAASSPHAPALLDPGLPAVSWSVLLQRIDVLATQLRLSGLTPSHTVAVMLPEGAAGLIAMLAVMRVCACSVLDPALTADELRTDLQAITAAAIVVAPGFVTAREVSATLGLLIFLAPPPDQPGQWFVDARPGTSLAAPTHHHHFALLLQTSATTGRRKVVPLTLSNVTSMAANTARCLQLTSEDRVLLMARPFHILGSLSAIAQLSVGGTVIAPPQLSAASFPAHLRDFRPTWYTAGPTTHRAILQQFPASSPPEPHSLRFIRSGGSTLPQSLRRQLTATFGVPIANGYGLSETGPITSTGFILDPPAYSVGSNVGPELAILRPSGEPLPPDQSGEIVVRGPAIMHAYFNDPEASAQAFHQGWFRTGDLGFLDASGQLFLSGRLKEIINRGGQKIIPNEIDAALCTHPAVHEAVAFGTPHRTLGEDIECAVILKEGFVASSAELRAYLASTLAPYKIPRRIHLVTSIPRGATGKPKRAALRDLLLQHGRPQDPTQAAPEHPAQPSLPSPVPSAAAVTPTATQPLDFVDVYLLELWRATLQLPHVGLDDDFFQLGGDSLGAITLLSQLEKEFQLPGTLSIERFIETPTPSAVMAMLEQAVTAPQQTTNGNIVYPLASHVEGSRLFLIPAGTSKGLYFRRLARHLRNVCPVALVIPEEHAPFRALYPIEDAARHAVAAIRAAQPSGPYRIGGYCHGGVVAFEAAAQLERLGETVSLVLFDTPSPLIPASIKFLGTHSRAKFAHVRKRRSLKPLLAAARMVGRRTHWFILRHSRPVLQRFWHLRCTERFFRLSNPSMISFYHPPVVKAGILHLLAASQQFAFRAESRHAWASRTSGSATSHTVAGDHESLFAEAHLPLVSEHIAAWI